MSIHRIPSSMRSSATILSLFFSSLGFAQLTVSPQTDLVQLARTITGPGVSISNPSINCHAQGYGRFQYNGSLLGIEEGILLTSGTITNAVGPNSVENKTFQQNRPGNSILNTVTGRTTYDACLFEFDVIPAGDSLRFDFVFASEEYNEWVGSQFNDVFGFFISGPGITGDPGIGNDKNIALVPNTNQAVAINNVNNSSNPTYYYDNHGGQHIQYDGFTQGLSAFSPVQPCETYHLKLVVADASDRKYDSGVFIAKVKSNPVTMQLITANAGDSLIEGCNDGVVRFTRQVVNDQPLPLEYYLHGTATNGVDYATIGNPDPGVPKTITIPANAAYVDQPISPILDGMAEGMETMLFILGNPNCPALSADTLIVPIVDSLFITAGPPTSSICLGGQQQLAATGGTSYSWAPAGGLGSATSSNPIAQPTTTTVYTVAASDGFCTSTAQVEVKVSNITASATIVNPLCNGDANGAINLSVMGGLPPYAFAWSGPNGFTANTEDLANIPAGTYTVTITDAACTKTVSYNVGQPAALQVTLTPSLLVFGQNISCHGGHDGTISTTITGGTGPYAASWAGPNGYTSSSTNISGLGAGTYSVTVTDEAGCNANDSIVLTESAPMEATITATNDVQCAGDGTGSATVQVTGGMPIYSYSWNSVPAQSTPTASGLAPGSYTVTATDQYGCTALATAVVDGPTVLLSIQLENKADVACHGAGNGSATISVSGGTPGYSVSWNTMPAQTGMTASGLSGGTYTATVTDANGCTATRMVTISEPAAPVTISISVQQHVNCHGDATGSATVNASGGTGPYSYTWNTVPPRNGASATGLPAGNWTVVATDINQCPGEVTVNITEPADPLAATIGGHSDLSCAGVRDGSATVVATGGTAPYTYTWNTTPTQSTPTATGLGAGPVQVNVTDALGCGASASATINGPAALTVSGTVTAAQCQGAANGAVDLSTSGGTAPYAWSWSGPNGFTASSEDVQNLQAGGYTVVVTDDHGCTATGSFDVNQPGLFTVDAITSAYGNANVSCPASTDGSIDLTVSGAVAPYGYAWTGPGGFTSSNEDLTGLAAGTYHVTITDDNGCSTSHEVTLVAPAPITAQFGVSNHGGTAISCNGGADGTISATLAGGNSPYLLSWQGPNGFTSSDQNLNGLEAGQYTLDITDQNECSVSSQVDLAQPPPLLAESGGTSAVTCFGSNTGQATVHVSGGRSPYTYTWNTTPVQHAATATGLAAGTYTVQVTDANGCSASATLAVGGPAAPLSVDIASLTHVPCFGGNTGTATVSASGGTGPYTYAWSTSPEQNGPTATGLTTGTWSVTVTDAAGCTSTRNVVITQPQQPLSAMVAQVHPVTCYGDQDGTISIQVTGGSGVYNIAWNTNPAQTGATATGLAPGNYIASITDANGCTQVVTLPVGVPGPLEPLSISMVPYTYSGGGHVSCPSSQDGSIDVTVTGGTPAYNYLWQDGFGGTFNMEDPSNLAAGTYHLEVIDGHGCFATQTITLDPPQPITATATVQSAICHGESNGAIDMTPAGGAPPYSFQWSGPDGPAGTTQDLSLIPAGVYTVTITDMNGCSIQQPFDVTEPGTFTFDATVEQAACSGSSDGAINVVAGGGTQPYSYSWIGPNGFTSSTPNNSGLAPGTYHLTLTDVNGCSALFTASIQAPPPLTAFVVSVKNHGGYDITCAGVEDGHIVANFSGGTAPYTFSWSGPNGFTASTQDIDNLAAGTYTLTITDAHNCTVTASTTLFAPPALTATATATTYAGGFNVSCNGGNNGTIMLVPNGGTPAYGVAWTGPGGFSANAWQITGLAPGTYTATVTDGNGCSTISTTTLNAPDPLVLTPTTTDISCNGGNTGAVDLQVTGGSGGYLFQWTGPGAFAQATEDITGLLAGTYVVTVTDANGCTASATANIAEAAPIEVSAQITTTECMGANNGAIDLNVTGGTGSYTFQWSGFPAFSSTSEDIDALFAGTYTVTITDAAGCSITQSYNVGQPDLFLIDALLGDQGGGYHVSCAGANDGSIQATVSGGTAPYTYFWTGPNGYTSIELDQDSLASGTYTLTVHDANGCNASASFTLVAPQPVQVGLTTTSLPYCSDTEEGSLSASVSGGVAPYTVAWTGPDGGLGIGETLTGIGAGTYSVVVTDALGCTGSASIVLGAPALLDAVATATVLPNGNNLSCANSADGSIDLDISGGTQPYLVQWDGPNGYSSNNADINGLAPGLYTAQIIDAHGCSAQVQVELTAPNALTLEITTSAYSGGSAISCAGAADGTITLEVGGGIPGYDINWSGPNGFHSTETELQGLAVGTYQVTVMDNAGCPAYASVTLSAPTNIQTSATLSDHDGFEVGCDGHDGAIDITVTGGQPPYQFDWSGPNGFASAAEDLAELIAGNYAVVISDANGCTASRTFTLNAPGDLALSMDVTSNECDISNNAEIDLHIMGGVAPFTITWAGPNGFTSDDEDLSGLASGIYSVTVTTGMGCSTTATATVLAAAPMELGLQASQYGAVNIPCAGQQTGAIELTVSGGFQPLDITWNGPDGFTAATPNINGLAAGSYQAVITDSHGCVRDTSITLVEPDLPLITTLDATDILCHGGLTGSIVANVVGGSSPYSYSWRGPDSTFYSTAQIDNLGAGNYELVVTDTNQCANTLQVTLTEPDSSLVLSLEAADHGGHAIACAGGSDGAIDPSVSGGTPGYTYAWTGPGGYTSSASAISGLEAGTYNVTVTDEHGCTASESILLDEAPPIMIGLTTHTLPSGSMISCFGADDGSITGYVGGGTGQLSWNWTGPGGFSSGSLAIDFLAPGTYCLNVQDGNGCEAQQCSTITEPSPLVVSAIASDAPCGLESGSVDATVTGGTFPYSFTWNNGADLEDLTAIPAGTYQLHVTDANNCTANVTAIVDGTPGVEAQATVTAPLCHGSMDGAIGLEISSGLAPISYLWSDGSTAPGLSGLDAGAYHVSVTDANGCTWEQTITVDAPEELTADTVISHYGNGYNISTVGGHDGSIILNIEGGTAPYSYAWNDGSHADARHGLPAGTYTVQVTDSHGCTLTLVIILTEPDELEMPTGFTPNGDGSNDAFVVHGLDAWPDNQLTVFNRWGNVVFDQLNYRNDWRGENQQGQALPNGTYFVVLRLGHDRILQNYVDLRR